MKQWRKFLLVILITISCFPSPMLLSAQDDELPVIQPHDVLVDPSLRVEKQSVLRFDDQRRVVQYFDPTNKQWQEIAYPTEVEAIKSTDYVRLRSDGTYLYNPDGFWGFSRELAETAWIIDPKLGQFRHPDEACWLVKSLPNEGQWRIIRFGAKGSAFLCSTETGTYSPTIPEKVPGTCDNYFRRDIALSPDRNWIIFFCSGGSATGLDFTAYSYQVDTQQFRYLGANPADYARFNENIRVLRWVNNTTAIIHTYPSWNPPANSYYVVDVSKENDLRFVAMDLYAAPRYIDDSPHVEWMHCEYGGCVPSEEYNTHGNLYAGEHGLRSFDFTTRRWTIYPALPQIWGISEVIPDGSGDRLYRALNGGDGFLSGTSATLIRFNYETQKTVTLYTGDIEWIDSLSADGRYVTLEMGGGHTVASSCRLADPQSEYHPDGNSRKGIFDLKTNKFVFQATGDEWRWYYENPLPFQWLNDQTFLIQHVTNMGDLIVHLANTDYSVRKVTVADPKNAWTPLSPNRRLLTVIDEQSNLAIYDIANGRTIPIVKASALTTYSVKVSWKNDVHLEIRISETPKDEYDTPPLLADWLVTIPQ